MFYYMKKKRQRLIDGHAKCDKTLEHGESERKVREHKQKGHVNMLVLPDSEKKCKTMV